MLWPSYRFWFADLACIEQFIHSTTAWGAIGLIRKIRLEIPIIIDYQMEDWQRVIPKIQQCFTGLKNVIVEFGVLKWTNREGEECESHADSPLSHLRTLPSRFVIIRKLLTDNLRVEKAQVWGLENPKNLPKEDLIAV